MSVYKFYDDDFYYFCLDDMPLDVANTFLQQRTRNGNGMLKYWHLPTNSIEENCRVIPTMYLAAYATHLVKAHNFDLNGYEKILTADFCIQCKTSDDPSLEKLIKTLVRGTRKETGSNKLPHAPFCLDHIDRKVKNVYAHSPFLTLMERITDILEEAPLSLEIHRLPFVSKRRPLTAILDEDIIPSSEFNNKYSTLTSDLEKKHVQFPVTADFFTIWRKVGIPITPPSKKIRRSERATSTRSTSESSDKTPKPSAKKTKTPSSLEKKPTPTPKSKKSAHSAASPITAVESSPVALKFENTPTREPQRDISEEPKLSPNLTIDPNKTDITKIAFTQIKTIAKQNEKGTETNEAVKRLSIGNTIEAPATAATPKRTRDPSSDYDSREKHLLELFAEAVRWKDKMEIEQLRIKINSSTKRKGDVFSREEIDRVLSRLDKDELIILDSNFVYPI